MPFEHNLDPDTNKDIIVLYQDGFVNWYSKSRKTPVFTAERLNGPLLAKKVSKVHLKLLKFNDVFLLFRNCQKGSI